jgi:regulator of sirC expression with transglutaminase-like and TPR domain
MNRFAAAIEDCDAVMKINPKGADTLVTRAGLKLQTADLTGAIDDATRAIEMGSKKPFAYFVRGMARLQTNQVFPACGDLRLYLKLDPGAPRAAKVREILERFGGS